MKKLFYLIKAIRNAPRKIWHLEKEMSFTYEEIISFKESLIQLSREIELINNEARITTLKNQEYLQKRVVQSTFLQREFFQSIKVYLRTHSTSLPLKRFGNLSDGGYVFLGLDAEKSHLVTFGVGDDISFEIEAANKFSRVTLFDHTVDIPNNISENTSFRPLKIVADESSNETEIGINQLLKELTSDPQFEKLVLKIDIEGNEWDIFSAMEEKYFGSISEIIVEFHGFKDCMYYEDYGLLVKEVLAKLHKYFFIFNIHGNNFGTSVNIDEYLVPDILEVTYLNRDIKLDNIKLSANYENLNHPNNPSIEDFTNLFWNL